MSDTAWGFLQWFHGTLHTHSITVVTFAHGQVYCRKVGLVDMIYQVTPSVILSSISVVTRNSKIVCKHLLVRKNEVRLVSGMTLMKPLKEFLVITSMQHVQTLDSCYARDSCLSLPRFAGMSKVPYHANI
jgi:hypothetical protein